MRVLNKRHVGRDAEGVYVGRPTKWGNPFSHLAGKGEVHVASRREAVKRYEEWFYAPEQRALRAAARRELRGHALICWCAPLECHAEVLWDYANRWDEHGLEPF